DLRIGNVADHGPSRRGGELASGQPQRGIAHLESATNLQKFRGVVGSAKLEEVRGQNGVKCGNGVRWCRARFVDDARLIRLCLQQRAGKIVAFGGRAEMGFTKGSSE